MEINLINNDGCVEDSRLQISGMTLFDYNPKEEEHGLQIAGMTDPYLMNGKRHERKTLK